MFVSIVCLYCLLVFITSILYVVTLMQFHQCTSASLDQSMSQSIHYRLLCLSCMFNPQCRSRGVCFAGAQAHPLTRSRHSPTFQASESIVIQRLALLMNGRELQKALTCLAVGNCAQSHSSLTAAIVSSCEAFTIKPSQTG